MVAFLSPPKVVILSPKKDSFREKNVLIKGKVSREATVVIADETVPVSKEGVFQYNFPLRKGKNLLTIKVVGANGKQKVFTKTFIKEE